MSLNTWPSWFVLGFACVLCAEDYNIQQSDGSYEFGYDNSNSYHHSKANRNNVVRGEFGGRDPKTGGVVSTSYTAGPRGYRPRGKNIHRKFDQNQNARRPIGSRDDPYFDPSEDPSYNYGFKTRTYSKQENANRAGDVTGQYTYVDDVGERHNVEYIAGSKTGFHVKTPFPDSNPRSYGPLYFNGRGKPIPRGRTSVQRGLDGSYRFVSAGPDQRRTETADALGNVRGSYTYLDDKGLQHSVHYIAGPQIGYRVLKNVKGPHLPTVFPFAGANIVPPDFYNYLDRNSGSTDIFDTAASGHVKPTATGGGDSSPDFEGDDFDTPDDNLGRPTSSGGSKPQSGTSNRPSRPSGGRPTSRPGGNKPSYEDDGGSDDGDIDDDLFGGSTGSVGSSAAGNEDSSRPTGSRPGSSRPESSRPGSSRPDSSRPDLSRPDSSRPGSSRPDSSRPDSSRPDSSRPKPSSGTDYDDGSYNPSVIDDDNNGGDDIDDDLFGGSPSGRPSTSRPSVTSRPSGGRPIRPGGVTSRPGGRPSRPTYEEDDDDSNDVDDDLFGGSGSVGGASTPRPPTLSIGVTGRPGRPSDGVSVKAHVQSIDLFPYESKVPSPSEQYRAETSNIHEHIVPAASEVHSITTHIPNTTETTEAPTTAHDNISSTTITSAPDN